MDNQIIPLNLREILTLHNILGEYLQENISLDIDVLEYSSGIINRVISDQNPGALIKALMLMSKKSLSELVGMNEYERSSLFMSCVVANRLWLLDRMLRNIGYGASKQ